METTATSKRKMTTIATIVLSVLMAMTAFSCKSPLFGLGGQVDLEAPRSISAESGQGSVRSGLITISGEAAGLVRARECR
ncbi:hypothetical protein MASR2M48_24840 [Spirochaetota bacterium]